MIDERCISCIDHFCSFADPFVKGGKRQVYESSRIRGRNIGKIAPECRDGRCELLRVCKCSAVSVCAQLNYVLHRLSGIHRQSYISTVGYRKKCDQPLIGVDAEKRDMRSFAEIMSIKVCSDSIHIFAESSVGLGNYGSVISGIKESNTIRIVFDPQVCHFSQGSNLRQYIRSVWFHLFFSRYSSISATVLNSMICSSGI